MYDVFKLEDYLSRYEFKTPYLMGNSDAETLSMKDLLSMADEESKNLWNTLSLGYTEVKGLPLLRKEIARLDSNLNQDNILCFAGAEEGFFCALHALLSPTDHVINITPCYQSLDTLPRKLVQDVTSINLLEEKGWELDVEDIKKAIKPNTKLIILNYPHNPTGKTLSLEQMHKIIEIAKRQDIYVFSDEVYRFLGKKPDFPSFSSLYEKGISLGVMSKALGLAGLRIGWISTQETELIEKIERVKHYTSICNSGPSEILALMALRKREAILKRNNTILDMNTKIFEAFLEEHNNTFSWVPSEGGCTGLVRYKGPKKFDTFIQEAREKSGILLLPASIYDMDTPHFRIGLGRLNFKEGLEQLKVAIIDK
jgi:aspartate/methionine/tyrosine aminotransferase